MKLTALMPVRNEDWVLGLSARVALLWCDELHLYLHACTDRSAEIAAQVQDEHPGRVVITVQPREDWPEMEHRQQMLEDARRMGATHIALVDADEALTGNLLEEIREQIMQLLPGQALHVGMPCPWRSLYQYRIGRSVWSNRWDLCLAFADAPGLNWHAVAGYDHHHREPYGTKAARCFYADGGALHLQFANWRRLVAKHRLYKIMERLKYPAKAVATIDRMYNLAVDENQLELAAVPAKWWLPYPHLLPYVNTNAIPWQEAEAERMLALHGRERFLGLDLFEQRNCWICGMPKGQPPSRCNGHYEGESVREYPGAIT